MRASTVLGVLILARNGDRTQFYQDPYSYEPKFTESTPLGAVESFQLGSNLKSIYLDSSSPLHIQDMPLDPTHPIPPSMVHVHAKAGGEGAAIFDSSIALLQGMFPPTPLNKITIANGTTVVSPLGGYQYVPVEMVPDSSDSVLESWIDCSAFKKHISKVYNSEEFKAVATEAQHFFSSIHDYVFGRPTTLENMAMECQFDRFTWCHPVYDYLNTELIHNQTFAFRLPPTLIEQARGYVNYHEDAVFSDSDIGGIGNIAGRTILHPILRALERIAFDDDPLRILLIETSYQPFISLFHMMDVLSLRPDLVGIPNYASALAFELVRGPAPEFRDFVRLKFKNGTDSNFETIRVFGHEEDSLPVTEFIYRLEHYAILDTKQWNSACGNNRWFPFNTAVFGTAAERGSVIGVLSALGLFAFSMFAFMMYVKQTIVKHRRRYTTVRQSENYATFADEKAGLLP
ncbi:histidine phosphatase superfamily [Scleroderma citrinum]